MALQGIEAPSETDIQYFLSNSDKYGTFLKSSRFIVRIMPIGGAVAGLINGYNRDLMYLCEAAEMPGRSFMLAEQRYYGPSHKIPFQSSYDDINLTFICRSESRERRLFDDWMAIINPPSNFDFEFRDNYRANIEVFQYSDLMISVDNPNPEPIYSFTLRDAYPTSIAAQSVTWADPEFLRMTVTFTYHFWIRKGMDVESVGGKKLVAWGNNTGLR